MPTQRKTKKTKPQQTSQRTSAARDIVILCGPSSTGKTTLSKTDYAEYLAVDSDGPLWFTVVKEECDNKGIQRFSPECRERWQKKLYERMVEHSRQEQKVVFVHPQKEPIVKALGKERACVVLVATSLSNIAKNIAKRGDRDVCPVLREYRTFFIPDHAKIPSEHRQHKFELRREEMDEFGTLQRQKKLKLRKVDEAEIKAVTKYYFPREDMTTVVVRPSIACDKLVVTGCLPPAKIRAPPVPAPEHVSFQQLRKYESVDKESIRAIYSKTLIQTSRVPRTRKWKWANKRKKFEDAINGVVDEIHETSLQMNSSGSQTYVLTGSGRQADSVIAFCNFYMHTHGTHVCIYYLCGDDAACSLLLREILKWWKIKSVRDINYSLILGETMLREREKDAKNEINRLIQHGFKVERFYPDDFLKRAMLTIDFYKQL